jgi:DNA-binding MarR family transcriptional regulator
MPPVKSRPAPSAKARASTQAGAKESDQLGKLFGEMTSHLYRRSAGDALQMMAEHGLTMAQMVTLHCLEHLTVQSVSRIAEILRLSLPATSHLVDRLVRAGLVARTEDPTDRRAKRVELTPEGSVFIRKLEAARTREVSQVLNHLSPDARKRLADAFSLVIEELAGLPVRGD